MYLTKTVLLCGLLLVVVLLSCEVATKKPNFPLLFNEFGSNLKNYTCLTDRLAQTPNSRNIIKFLEKYVEEENNLYEAYEKSLNNVLLNKKIVQETSKRIPSMEEEIKLFGDVNNFAKLYELKNKNNLENQIDSVIKTTTEALEDAKKSLNQRKDTGDSLMKIYLAALVDYEFKREEREKIFNSTLKTFGKIKETNSTILCNIINTEIKQNLLDCSLVRPFSHRSNQIPQQIPQKTQIKSISHIIKSGPNGGSKSLNVDMTQWKKGQTFKVAVKTSKVHIGLVFSILNHASKPIWRYEIPQEGIITSPTLTYTEGGYITYTISLSSNSEDLQVVLTAE